MFGLFKRTKIQNWEIDLLRIIVNQISPLPDFYKKLIKNQLDEGILKGVILNASDIEGYVAFTYKSDLMKKYDNPKEKNYRLRGIKVFDIVSNKYLDYTLFLSSGTVSGYAIQGAEKYKIDCSKTNISQSELLSINNNDFERLSEFLTPLEQKILNPSNVYSIILKQKEYFHIKEIGDGDFIGIDLEKKIYKITHDPFEINKLDLNLKEIMEQ